MGAAVSDETGRRAEAPEPLRLGPKALAAVGANPTEARAPPAVGNPGPPEVGSGGQVRMGAANPGRGVTAFGLAAMGRGNASAFPLAGNASRCCSPGGERGRGHRRPKGG